MNTRDSETLANFDHLFDPNAPQKRFDVIESGKLVVALFLSGHELPGELIYAQAALLEKDDTLSVARMYTDKTGRETKNVKHFYTFAHPEISYLSTTSNVGYGMREDGGLLQAREALDTPRRTELEVASCVISSLNNSGVAYFITGGTREPTSSQREMLTGLVEAAEFKLGDQPLGDLLPQRLLIN